MKITTLFLFLITFSVSAQKQKSEFHKAVDSINTIITSNKKVYFIDNKRSGAFVKRIEATKNGAVTFTDSVPETVKTITIGKQTLLPDCCPQKTVRSINLFEIKKWDIHFPYTKLMSKNNTIYGEFYGIREKDLFLLKEQFEKLTALCKKENKH
ncbi:hypothetical protein FEDK69T_15120 [Flavobacterium enshiense DK69]|uniref:Uncharacterized protein n=1 Tax=Flavobacterium enshiense DK69 TaxID=1107311 RepID=V6SG09_9FLAO|nr:hypothetical protein [Flavobacterium enshiense]ESU23350.1 hypothetical protein FEDK69T_15120 [Flavobacterium enshiense DK69]KGO96418.1 hypothetical protein Q767_05795 [Flavobacterium enshiense DK69]